MPHLLLISSSHGYRHAAIVEHGELVEFYSEKASKPSIVGNIYKGRVVRILPGMQSAFVEIGLDRAGFLYAGDLHIEENNAIFQEDFEEIDKKEDKSNGEGINGDLPVEGIEEDGGADNGMANEGFALAAARSKAFVPPNIEEVLNVNEDLLVQIVKDPIHGKGARLTSQISIPGRYLVFFPFYNHSGISRRITSEEERTRLKGIAERLASNGCGVIIRTAAEGKPENEIVREFEFLKKTFASIDEKQKKISAPALIFEDLDLVLRGARDNLKEGFDMMIIDNVADFRRVKDFVASYMPEFLEKIDLYEGGEPLFEHYGVYHGVFWALERIVWLKSGGTIVIDHTEALTTVDVNTSRFTGKRDLEETILKTNLEAVKEIAFQLRLRNIGGIIIIDFIDMKENANR
ncbi:MAG: Rne/Rng family ribonuclease, partial [Deltaproteobacteria bacterium]|nr:Rne/Rng family ribonuclease [Deltaproteobacteria bacterium]